jgi:hypothetical protein
MIEEATPCGARCGAGAVEDRSKIGHAVVSLRRSHPRCAAIAMVVVRSRTRHA